MSETFKPKKNGISKQVGTLVLSFVMMAIMSIQAYAVPKQMPDGNIFDAEFYATIYPDVAATLGTDAAMLYKHYVLCGKAEGRLPFAPNAAVTPVTAPATGVKVMPDGNLFDAVFYATRYPDIVAVLGTDEVALYNHYLLCGKAEGRLPYELTEQEVKNQEIYNKIMALKEIYPQGMKWDESNTYVIPQLAGAKPEGWFIIAETGERVPFIEANRENGWAGYVCRACQAFAYTIQDTAFGTGVKIKTYRTGLGDWCIANAGGRYTYRKGAWIPEGYVGQDPVVNAKFEDMWNKIQVGDAIVDGNHIMVVLTKADDCVTVVEGNHGGKVNWGRKKTKEQLRISLVYVETPSW